MTAHPRLTALRGALKARFIERDALVDAALGALVAGQHLLVIGPPGTAKSELVGALTEAIEGATGFQWLLTRFTTPEELFGPVSLAGLEVDRYERVTAGKLPEAHVVFLDEVFKASSAILNALLTVLNERRFHNGGAPAEIPLLSLFGAANELPEEDELLALYDRFLVRVVVDYIEEDFRFLKLLSLPEPGPLPTLTLADVQAARAAAAAVPVEGQVLRDLAALRRGLAAAGVVASDRRWRQALGYLRARAWLDGDARVTVEHLGALRDVLWSALDDREAVDDALARLVSGARDQLQALVFQAREVAEYPDGVGRDPAAQERAAVEAWTKLGVLLSEAREARAAAVGQGRGGAALDAAVAEIDQLRATLGRRFKALQ